jgi:hypothetical protein
MPLTKVQKALYEAALRRKGLQPGKAVRQDPRTFVGPIQTELRPIPSSRLWNDRLLYSEEQVPANTYLNHRGRLEDLEDELSAAIDAGIWERRNPMARRYYRYYNDGDMPAMPGYPTRSSGGYCNPYAYKYQIPRRFDAPNGEQDTHLTRLGELELEARADEMIENDYKDYLKKMLQRFPNRAAVREQFPEEYNAMPYLEDLFPEEY